MSRSGFRLVRDFCAFSFLIRRRLFMSNLRFMAKLFSSCLSYFILQSISRGPTVILTTKRPDLALLVGR